MSSEVNEMIDELDTDEAEHIFSQFDPDGPFRYTGEHDGWWRALKMMDPKLVRGYIEEMRREA